VKELFLLSAVVSKKQGAAKLMLIFFYASWINAVVSLETGTSYGRIKRGLYMMPFKADVRI